VEAERRQVTILFADMVGFTAFSERAGEEAAFTLMQGLAKLMGDAVRERGGVVRGFTGDGIMAVFGAPLAFEDAPVRACKAALTILDVLKAASGDMEAKRGVRPELRIGLNSGPAVVGAVQEGDDAAVTVLGDTVNVAARLQTLAEPGSAVMSDTVRRLTEGVVEATFVGEYPIKGKSNPQKAYRLEAIRQGATRFDARVRLGLTTYVGRDRELEMLVRGLDSISNGVQAFDIVGEPGIGKSRLVHEFIGQMVKERTRIIGGSCTPDGQQTPFRAFIEILRVAFRLSPVETNLAVTEKLDDGLKRLGLRSSENVGLLLNLLGIRAPDEALAGLDGVLIGLRTRDLLQSLVHAQCRLTPMIMVVEDLHWLDSASEDLLARIITIEDPLQLLILHTRRPEYPLPWAGRQRVTQLIVKPLAERETARVAQARIGAGDLPEDLAKLIAARADGNALFAEEIAAFLIERGIVRRSATGLDFDSTAVAAALPESVQSLLAFRVDRLDPADRTLLQAAAVAGRHFDPDLVGAIAGDGGNVATSFAAMEALDLVHHAEGSSDYVFKHALVRDAVYDGLLKARRTALHLRVAEELERRGANRLTEIADTLAHHYAETTCSEKAFTYLVMAGDKALDVYSVNEAEQYFRRAVSIFEKEPESSGVAAAAHAVVRLLEALTLKSSFREIEVISTRFIRLLDTVSETPDAIIAIYYRSQSLIQSMNFREAHEILLKALPVAERHGNGRAIAYIRGCLLECRSILALDPPEPARIMRDLVMEESRLYGDNFIQNWSYFFVSFDYLYRGLAKEAEEVAVKLFASGEKRRDPRALALAGWMLGFIYIAGELFEKAELYASESLAAAITPSDRLMAALVKANAGLFLGRADKSVAQLDALIDEFEKLGMPYAAQALFHGVALVMCGRISEGIRTVKQHIARRDAAGDVGSADWGRITLAEIYIEIMTAKEKPKASTLLQNAWTLLGVLFFGVGRANALLREAAARQHWSDRGVVFARMNFDLGVLSMLKKKRADAESYFKKARVAAEGQGADKLVLKIDTALQNVARI
jgi:class 3 adenylate cyclase